MRFTIALLKFVARVTGFFKGRRWRFSQGHEDDFRHMSRDEKLFWFYKSVIRQVELPEEGSGLEARFGDQDFDFTPPPSFKPEASLVISAGGDLSAMELIRPDNTGRLWDEVGGFLFGSSADGAGKDRPFAVANLETPLCATKPPVGVPPACLTTPELNGSAAMFERFQSAGGFGLLATANNHSFDQGEPGIFETIDFLDSRGLPHVGTAKSPRERDAFPIIERNGVRVAFLSWTYCLNGKLLPEGKEHLANVIRLNKAGVDVGPIAAQARAARERGADFVVAILHWSVEFEAYPTSAVVDSGRRIAEAGVDLILGGHPHNAQPSERVRVRDAATGRERDALIVYSLGELVSLNLHTKNSRLAQLVRVELTRGTEAGQRVARITRFEVLPILTSYRPERGEYRVLDLKSTLARVAAGESAEGYSKAEIAEFRRLEGLAHRTMLPRKTEGLLARAGAWGRR